MSSCRCVEDTDSVEYFPSCHPPTPPPSHQCTCPSHAALFPPPPPLPPTSDQHCTTTNTHHHSHTAAHPTHSRPHQSHHSTEHAHTSPYDAPRPPASRGRPSWQCTAPSAVSPLHHTYSCLQPTHVPGMQTTPLHMCTGRETHDQGCCLGSRLPSSKSVCQVHPTRRQLIPDGYHGNEDNSSPRYSKEVSTLSHAHLSPQDSIHHSDDHNHSVCYHPAPSPHSHQHPPREEGDRMHGYLHGCGHQELSPRTPQGAMSTPPRCAHVRQARILDFSSPLGPPVSFPTSFHMAVHPSSSRLTVHPSSSRLTVHPSSSDLTVHPSSTDLTVHPSSTDLTVHPSSTDLTVHPSSTDLSVHPSSTDLTVHPSSTDLTVHPSSTDLTVHPSSTDLSVHPSSTDLTVHPSSTDLTVHPSSTDLTVHSTDPLIHPSSTDPLVHPSSTDPLVHLSSTDSLVHPSSTDLLVHTSSSKLAVHPSSIQGGKDNKLPSLKRRSRIGNEMLVLQRIAPTTQGTFQSEGGSASQFKEQGGRSEVKIKSGVVECLLAPKNETRGHEEENNEGEVKEEEGERVKEVEQEEGGDEDSSVKSKPVWSGSCRLCSSSAGRGRRRRRRAVTTGTESSQSDSDMQLMLQQRRGKRSARLGEQEGVRQTGGDSITTPFPARPEAPPTTVTEAPPTSTIVTRSCGRQRSPPPQRTADHEAVPPKSTAPHRAGVHMSLRDWFIRIVLEDQVLLEGKKK